MDSTPYLHVEQLTGGSSTKVLVDEKVIVDELASAQQDTIYCYNPD